MRVMVWADVEGVAGITSWEHTGGRTPLYEEGRRLYTEEINAIVRGCKRAQASDVIVVDGHGGGYDGARGDHVLLAPPFIVEERQLDELVDKLATAIGAVERQAA